MKKLKVDFKSSSRKDGWYDLKEDWALVEASFAKQYGIRLMQNPDMKWGEFCSLLAGLMHDTPLGQIITIRSETDREIIKKFNSNQKKIYNDWKDKLANNKLKDEKELDKQIMQIEKELERLFGNK